MDYWKGRKSTVTVLYSYVYDNRHQRVCINEGERLILMEKTNSDWWQVTLFSPLLCNHHSRAFIEAHQSAPSIIRLDNPAFISIIPDNSRDAAVPLRFFE